MLSAHPHHARYVPPPPAPAYSTAYMRATLANACMSPARTMLPASQLRGLSASGAASSAITARQAACRLQAGDHSFFKMSRQISPVWFGLRFGIREDGELGWAGSSNRSLARSLALLAGTDLEVDVGVEDARDEAHHGRPDRVLLPDLDADLEAAALEGRVGGPADEGLCCVVWRGIA